MAADGWDRDGPYERLVTPEFVITALVGDHWPDDQVDLTVEAGDGVPRYATFFTLEAIRSILDWYATSGEGLSGTYFWSENPVFVRTLDRDSVEAVVRDLIRLGELSAAFATEEPPDGEGEER